MARPKITLEDMRRAILIDCCQDGTITWRPRGTRPFNGAALPVYSVDTPEEAEALQVLLCARQYTEHPLQPGRPWYVWPGFAGEVETLRNVSVRLREAHARMAAQRPSPTMREARAELAALGLAIKKQDDDEYRVNFRGGAEASAYYTNDLADAVATGRDMARRRAERNEIGLYRLAGRCANGAERDGGSRVHAVPVSEARRAPVAARALCGAIPGRTSGGWGEAEGAEQPTCPRCARAAHRRGA